MSFIPLIVLTYRPYRAVDPLRGRGGGVRTFLIIDFKLLWLYYAYDIHIFLFSTQCQLLTVGMT